MLDRSREFAHRAPGLRRDCRGGSNFAELLILVALAAFLVLASVRLFGGVVLAKFNDQSSDIAAIGSGATGRTGGIPIETSEIPTVGNGPSETSEMPFPGPGQGTTTALPTPSSGEAGTPGSSPWWSALAQSAVEWATGFLSGTDAVPDYDQSGEVDIVHPDGTIEENVSLDEVLARVRSGEIVSGGVNGALNGRDLARENYQARAATTGQSQVLIYYPQGIDFSGDERYRDEVRDVLGQVRDAAGKNEEPFSWSCHSHSCHFVADELHDASGQTLDAYAPAHDLGDQREAWERGLTTSELDRVTIYRGTEDMLSNGLATDADEVRGNANVDEVEIDGAGHEFQDLLSLQPPQ